jgi:hypothetical protein
LSNTSRTQHEKLKNKPLSTPEKLQTPKEQLAFSRVFQPQAFRSSSFRSTLVYAHHYDNPCDIPKNKITNTTPGSNPPPQTNQNKHNQQQQNRQNIIIDLIRTNSPQTEIPTREPNQEGS